MENMKNRITDLEKYINNLKDSSINNEQNDLSDNI